MNETINKATKRVAIVGAGELGIQALHYLELMNKDTSLHKMIGWFDDAKNLDEDVYGFKILGGTDVILNKYKDGYFDCIFIAIGYNHLDIKAKLIDSFRSVIPLINIIAPDTFIDPSTKLGNNIIVYPGVVLDKEVTIEDGVVLNLGVIVSHNSIIRKCSFLAPRVTVAGFTEIAECCFLGVSSSIIDNISVCSHVKISAGAVIIEDINDPGLYIGVPAKKYIRFHPHSS